MKYLIVSKRNDNPEDFMIYAEVNDLDIAEKICSYWNTIDKHQFYEVHHVMDNDEVVSVIESISKN